MLTYYGVLMTRLKGKNVVSMAGKGLTERHFLEEKVMAVVVEEGYRIAEEVDGES